MAIDERNRLQLAEAAKRVLGDDEGITLMELLPPVGWADVATKQDLACSRPGMDARFDRIEAQSDARFATVDARFSVVEEKLEQCSSTSSTRPCTESSAARPGSSSRSSPPRCRPCSGALVGLARF